VLAKKLRISIKIFKIALGIFDLCTMTRFIARGVGMKEREGKENIKDKVIFVASYKLQGSILRGYG
jgi:hypothetical protein